MSIHLEDPSEENDRRRKVDPGASSMLRQAVPRHTEQPAPILTAMNSPSLDGLLAGKADPTAKDKLFSGMYDGDTTPATRSMNLMANPATQNATNTIAPVQTPHNGYTQADLNSLYSDQAGYSAKDRQYKELDFWVNRIAEGEGRFNSSSDLGDGGRLSVGILQWTQNSKRLGGLMQDYQNEARTEGHEDIFNSTFGGQRTANSTLSTLTGKNPNSIASSTIQSQFANAGNIDMFKRAQVQRARTDVRHDLESVNGMVPVGADGDVSGKQLAAALIMNNIGPKSPDRIFKAVDQIEFDSIKNQRPDVNKELGLSTDQALAKYQYQHSEDLKGMSVQDRAKVMDEQRDLAKQNFYGNLGNKYGDVSTQANAQTETALAQYEKDHNLDPNNPAQKAQIDKARADIGIQQYQQLVSKGPTIGQRVDNEIKSESSSKIDLAMAEYQRSHAADLQKMTPAKRAKALAAEKATANKSVTAEMTKRRGELQRTAVQDNVSETDYNNRLITEVPKRLYGAKNYAKYHKGVENRLRSSMGEIDAGHRVNMNDL